jgi:hypothetical protein
MHRRTIIASVVFGLCVHASAQTPPTETVSVSGCVERAQRDGSLSLTAAGTTATPNTAATEGNSGVMVDAFRLTNATPIIMGAGRRAPSSARSTESSTRTAYALQGSGQELAAHVGHRVQIIGSLLPSIADSQTEPSTPAEGIRRVQVATIKFIDKNCSPRNR